MRCTVLPRPGAFVLDNVPTGKWYVLARSVTRTGEGRQVRHTPTVGGFGPITASADHAPEPVVLRLCRVNLATLRLCSAAHQGLHPAPAGS